MARNLFDLTGKVALITGGNAGLGLGMATGLAEAGADIVIWGRREEINLEAAERLRVHGGRVGHLAVDVANEHEVVDGFASATAQFGRVDCVIVNAGIADITPFHEMTTDIWEGLLGVNLHGAFYTCREATRHMRERAQAGDPGESIILNGSLAVFAGVPGMEHYATAKDGLNSMSKGLAVELAPHGIRVNMICPGYFASDLGEADSPMVEMLLQKTPAGRVGRPEDLAGIVVYLASDRSSYHTGDTITIDGGIMAQCF
ncbi:NAD(P)-dependent dehydrogenase (short-subunit alcohol dehydrogenase family) [Sphingobium xenophagum]|uniref:NAD(P)-dependent dehydrogenase (Short-subunit alcohol dehydrogenase family) n=1 Tax=Sphingobium xenophagum TaxID=121428 RepID=A0ABU1X5Y9_SPHXE|nr:SDR family oxidoreductase [Sphingobium xenophagum]MDR7156452.1 NAD(P)-dependent dehydrogenase (short-subunit alcohol dehydrogenase family) [Sphingobium xenophagum]